VVAPQAGQRFGNQPPFEPPGTAGHGRQRLKNTVTI
jgi:hypothetical protein